jgi:hypothetical protein
MNEPNGFDDRTRGSLEALGRGLAMLNHRLDVAEGVAGAAADANIETSRDIRERLAAQERRLDSLERALLALARTLGVSPVWSDEGDAAASGGMKH